MKIPKVQGKIIFYYLSGHYEDLLSWKWYPKYLYFIIERQQKFFEDIICK